jgi:hypothetical protein
MLSADAREGLGAGCCRTEAEGAPAAGEAMAAEVPEWAMEGAEPVDGTGSRHSRPRTREMSSSFASGLSAPVKDVRMASCRA